MRTNSGAVSRRDLAVEVDGHTLRGTVLVPEAPRAVVTVHPATATPGAFYGVLLDHLAASGFVALTYDYRGTGTSGSPREHRDVLMRDWIDADAPAVAAWALAEFGDLPQLAVGHSIGGHALVLGAGGSHLRGFATVASHLGSTRTVATRAEHARVFTVLHVVGPLTARLLGYVPGRRMGLGEDMPAAAMIEWGRWAAQPDYFLSDPSLRARERAAEVTCPVRAYSASDDLWATPFQADALVAPLVNATVERITLTPADLGQHSVGHHGLMRRTVGPAWWPDLVDFFDGLLGAAPDAA